MEKPRPYLTAAMLCEKVLEEKNGTLSVIRIADRLGYQLPIFPPGVPMPEGIRAAAQLSGLICLKSGPVTGDHSLSIIVENPVGDRKQVFVFPLKLEGKDQGQNVVLNMALGIEHDGLYWFDVLFDGEVLTRIPLTVVQESAPVPQVQQS
jgi:hypothetical protein